MKETEITESLLKRIEQRMADPKLNANFNREVSRECNATTEDKHNYAIAQEEYLRYTNGGELESEQKILERIERLENDPDSAIPWKEVRKCDAT